MILKEESIPFRGILKFFIGNHEDNFSDYKYDCIDEYEDIIKNRLKALPEITYVSMADNEVRGDEGELIIDIESELEPIEIYELINSEIQRHPYDSFIYDDYDDEVEFIAEEFDIEN